MVGSIKGNAVLLLTVLLSGLISLAVCAIAISESSNRTNNLTNLWQNDHRAVENQRSKQFDSVPSSETSATSAWDFWYVARVVAAESRGEPLIGQMAVAQCIRNTAEATGQTPEEVVKVKNQYASPVDSDLVDASIFVACFSVFYENASVTSEPIRYFYSPAGGFYSAWHEEHLAYVMTIGGHKFYKEDK